MENTANRRGIREETIINDNLINELRDFGCNEYLIKHSILVAKVANKIVQYLKKNGCVDDV
jgi:hypothetical protein